MKPRAWQPVLLPSQYPLSWIHNCCNTKHTRTSTYSLKLSHGMWLCFWKTQGLGQYFWIWLHSGVNWGDSFIFKKQCLGPILDQLHQNLWSWGLVMGILQTSLGAFSAHQVWEPLDYSSGSSEASTKCKTYPLGRVAHCMIPRVNILHHKWCADGGVKCVWWGKTWVMGTLMCIYEEESGAVRA